MSVWTHLPKNKDIIAGEEIFTFNNQLVWLENNQINGVTLQAKKNNKGSVFIGGYLELEAGDSISLEINNTSHISIKGEVQGDGINYLGVKN